MAYPDLRARASAVTLGGMPPAGGLRTIFYVGRAPQNGSGCDWSGPSALRQNLFAVGQVDVHLGALVLQQAGISGLDDGKQLAGVGQSLRMMISALPMPACTSVSTLEMSP